MTEWFNKRYISRDEHDQVVEYYRRQVAQLYEKLSELRTVLDAQNLDTMVEHSRRVAERELRKSAHDEGGNNVISVDFRRPH
jgi:uncharacterized protein YbjQ (UPF0145 family)